MEKKNYRNTNLQIAQPPISNSGALTTLVNRITIGLAILEDFPKTAFLPRPFSSAQFAQCQSPSGRCPKFKQAATKKFNGISDERKP